MKRTKDLIRGLYGGGSDPSRLSPSILKKSSHRHIPTTGNRPQSEENFCQQKQKRRRRARLARGKRCEKVGREAVDKPFMRNSEASGAAKKQVMQKKGGALQEPPAQLLLQGKEMEPGLSKKA